MYNEQRVYDSVYYILCKLRMMQRQDYTQSPKGSLMIPPGLGLTFLMDVKRSGA